MQVRQGIPIFACQYFPAFLGDKRFIEHAVRHGFPDGLHRFFDILGKQQHIIACQQCLHLCFSRRGVLRHALHVHRIRETDAAEPHLFFQQPVDDGG